MPRMRDVSQSVASLEESKSHKSVEDIEMGSSLLQWGLRKCGGVGGKGWKMSLERQNGDQILKTSTTAIVCGMGQRGLKRR